MQDVVINTLNDILEEIIVNKNKYKCEDEKYLEYKTKEMAMEMAINKLKA